MEKRILFIVTGFIAGTAISLLVYYNLTGLFPNAPLLALLTVGGGVSGVLLQSIFYVISRKINGRILWQEQFSLRFLIDFVFNGLGGILISGVILMIVLKLSTKESVADIWASNWQGFAVLWILTMVFVILYNIITLVLYAYYHYAEGQISTIKKDRKQLKLQYQALKNQLSPHYLFNSLNTISSLIHKDKASAEEYIRRLADTYQYILNTHKHQLVSLGEEVAFAKAYYYLLCVRYREGLNLNINIPDQLLTYRIPPLTLQILVENAIKHNVFSADEPLNIYLGVIDNSEIRVVNNKTQPPHSVNSNKIGLDNIKMRYSFLTNDQVSIINEESFEVKVPIIKSEQISKVA